VRTLVVGVGNEDRGDDGAGPLVARLLAADPPPGVAVRVWTGDPLRLLDLWAGVDHLVLVDAVAAGERPGTVRRFGADAPFRCDAGTSTHGFGVAATLALARALGRAPTRIDVWGIEGGAFEAGTGPSPDVAQAAQCLALRLCAELSPAGRGAGAPAG
jgi:hydrogenase maturation protease